MTLRGFRANRALAEWAEQQLSPTIQGRAALPRRPFRQIEDRDTVRPTQRGSVLIIVLWIAFGLVSIALYFAHSMTYELKAADNQIAGLEAEQAIEAAARYIKFFLSNEWTPGQLPDLQTYLSEAVPVGVASFWLIGRTNRDDMPETPYFSLIDEGSKLNLNTATADMLSLLPRMTPDVAAAIVDWRDADSTVSPSGAESETYSRLKPPYNCKNAPFETVDEVRLVAGAEWDILYGEDANLNGVLDPNENDGTTTMPDDNHDGRLDRGILDYLTVYTTEPPTTTNGVTRTNVNDTTSIISLLGQQFSASRSAAIIAAAGLQPAAGAPAGRGGGGGTAAGGGRAGGGVVQAPAPTFQSVLEFYVKSTMTLTEFEQIADLITTSSTNKPGLVNVNTATADVLTCIPGVGTDKAQALIAYRIANPDKLISLAWVVDILGGPGAIQAGPYLTTRSYQFTADIAAVGHYGRGYRRVRFVFDTSSGTPQIVYRQDLTHLGWALGKQAREGQLVSKQM